MKSNIAQLLNAQQKEHKLSVDALSKKIGVSSISVRGVLSGKSTPNKSTIAKYAAFLGVDVATLAGADKSAKKPGTSKGPKGSKAKAKATVKVTKAAKGGSPTKAAKRGRAARSAFGPVSGSRRGFGSDLMAVAAVAASVLDDALAIAIHRATPTERDLVSRLLGL